MQEFLDHIDISQHEFEKLRHYARYNWRVFVSYFSYYDYFSIWLRPNSKTSITIRCHDTKRIILLLDVLNVYGSRSWTKNSGVQWRISSRFFLTALRLLWKAQERLEEITQGAETPEQFLALAVLVD